MIQFAYVCDHFHESLVILPKSWWGPPVLAVYLEFVFVHYAPALFQPYLCDPLAVLVGSI